MRSHVRVAVNVEIARGFPTLPGIELIKPRPLFAHEILKGRYWPTRMRSPPPQRSNQPNYHSRGLNLSETRGSGKGEFPGRAARFEAEADRTLHPPRPSGRRSLSKSPCKDGPATQLVGSLRRVVRACFSRATGAFLPMRWRPSCHRHSILCHHRVSIVKRGGYRRCW